MTMKNIRFYASTCRCVVGRMASQVNLANSRLKRCRVSARVVRQMLAAAALFTGAFLTIHAIAADYARIAAVTDTQPPVHTHDLAVVSIKAPKKVTLTAARPTVVTTARVAIQNRSPYVETIPDLSTLTKLVSLSVVPETTDSNCAAPAPVLHAGKPQPVLPVILKPNKTLKVVFDVTYTCAVDPLKGLGHEDYHYLATVDASAIDGQEDVNPASDICPREPLPVGTDPFPDVSIRDRGCGGKLPGKTLGAAVLTDIMVKSVNGVNKTYTISGVVVNAASKTAIPDVSIYLSGSASAITTTNLKGEYRFSGLTAGDYSITPNLVRTSFSPSNRSITVTGASVAKVDFAGVPASPSLIASGIDFLPDIFISTNQYRTSLVVSGENVFFTDSSDSPLKKFSLSDLVVTPLAQRIGTPESVVLHGENIVWVDGGRLNVTSLDGTQTTVLAHGERDVLSGVTTDVVVDDANVYWVNTVSSWGCSPSCTWIIQQVPLAGGKPITLATANRRIVALASDASNIYWEEESQDALEPGCQCGSSIKMVPKTGGLPVVLVDGALNGSLPPPPPGYTAGSWTPAGGLAVNASQIIFGTGNSSSYQIKSVSNSGGDISTLADVSSTLAAVRNLTVDQTNVYWIDRVNHTLNALPVGGGNVTVLASDLVLPSDSGNPVALAITADSAYWTEPGPVGSYYLQMGTGRIRTVSLSGGTVDTVVGGIDGPVALAVDQQTLVWVENWRIAKSLIGDGLATTLVSGITTEMPRIAVDQSYVYVLDGNYVKKIPINGGTPEKLISINGGNPYGLIAPNYDIATDGSNIYWTDGGSVNKVAIAGGTATMLALSPESYGGPQECYWRVAVDALNVYWSSTSSQFPIGCNINKVPKDGGSATSLVDVAYLRDFTVDGTDVYFSEVGTNPGSIRKISINGGPVSTVATNIFAWVLANDEKNVYWIDPGFNGGIGIISKSGPQGGGFDGYLVGGSLLTDPYLAAEAIAVVQGSIYWTESVGGDIYSIK